MLTFKGSPKLRRIVVLNPKGGSGKSTLAFNVAGYLASAGRQVALADMDPQGSGMRWLSNRPSKYNPILGLSVADLAAVGDHNHCLEVPDGVTHLVVDAPAGVPAENLIDYTCGAHAILIPVLPSDLDIHAASRLISDLLLVAQVSRKNRRVGVIANRVKERTLAYRQLMRFLERLTIEVVGVLRDSQSYTKAARSGICIHEMPRAAVSKDLAQWEDVTRWLESRLARPLTARDLRRPEVDVPTEPPAPVPVPVDSHRRRWQAAAASIGLIGLAWLFGGALVSSEDTSGEGQPVPEAASASLSPSTSAAQTPASSNRGDFKIAATSGEATARSEKSRMAAEFRRHWQLSGVARTGALGSALLVTDVKRGGTHRVVDGDRLDGWTVTQIGADYAVMTKDGAEVRVMLHPESDKTSEQNVPETVADGA